MHGAAPGSSRARAAPENPHGACTRPARGKSSPAAPGCPADALTPRRHAGLRSPQCHACRRGALQCHARRGVPAVPVSGVGGCNSGARQAAASHSHNKPRTSPGGRAQSPCGRCCPGAFCAAAAAPWPPTLAGDACRRQQNLARPGSSLLVPAAGGTGGQGVPELGTAKTPPEKPSLGPAPQGGGRGTFLSLPYSPHELLCHGTSRPGGSPAPGCCSGAGQTRTRGDQPMTTG